jgi:hypothetical protein
MGLGPGVGTAAAAPGDVETVTTCTEAALRQAIDDVPDGGTVAIACDDPILLTPEGGSTIVVDKTMTLSGTGHSATIDGGQRTSLLTVQAPGGMQSPDDLPTLTLRDLELTGGWSQDEGYVGGGAVANFANLVAERVDFVGNRAFNRGGAILSEGFGRLTVVDSTFTGNRVTCPLDGSGGGAIAVRQRQQTTITKSTFEDNSAMGLASGGAVLAYVSSLNAGFPSQPPPAPLAPHPSSAPVVISGSVFTGNQVTVAGLTGVDRMFGGGAVASFDHPLAISTSHFEGNLVHAPAVGYGGAILAASIRVTPTEITTVDVWDNGFPDRMNGTPTNGIGGGVALHGTPATVDDTVIDGNRAFVGGGLYTRGGPVEFVDSLLEANVAGAVTPGNTVHGGGLTTYGPLTLTGSGVLGNSGGSCRILSEDGSMPTEVVIVDGGGNEVDRAETCFRVATPSSPPAATGVLTAPTDAVTLGSPLTLSGSGLAPDALVSVVGYRLDAPPAPAGTASAAMTTASAAMTTASAAPLPVDLGAGQADGTGAFTVTPVLPTAGVWQVVVLGGAADGGTAALTAFVVSAASGVGIAPVVTSQPAPVTTAPGSSVTLSASAAGAPAPTVRWQSSGDGGTTWADVPGATGGALAVTVAPGSTLYRAVFTNSTGSTATTAAAVTATGSPTTPPPGTSTPVRPDAGSPASGTPALSGPQTGGGTDPDGPPSGSGLARTGTDLLPLAGAGAVSVLLGCVVLLALRRRSAG